ncbi:DUF6988 family protein [Pseudomonas sp. NPDC089547]|uniref:DUF6988 family protein n=1 Tax=Pseudomonas sp. NPDC089547 TaxID=3390652 RepID=UPI003CFD67B5
MLEKFMDGSDELHAQIVDLLQEIEVYPGIRHELALTACGLAVEHALSLRCMVRIRCYTSAFSMLRLQYEALARGVWLLYAATDSDIEVLASPLTVNSEQAAKKMPMFSKILTQVVEKAPVTASMMLLNFKDVNYHAMNSYVHSGIHPLRRHAEGYPVKLIQDAVANSNGLNMMTLQLGFVLTGSSDFDELLKEVQNEYREFLPCLTGVSNRRVEN